LVTVGRVLEKVSLVHKVHRSFSSGLPDGIFLNQKAKFYVEGLPMEDVDIFFVLLEDLKAIWYILLPFGLLFGYLVYFFTV
jgi:hypothetical protein